MFVVGSFVVLKLFEEILFVVIILVEIFDKVGVFKGVFNLVNGDGFGVGNFLSEYLKVRMMLFIGFGFIGLKIMEKVVKDFKKVFFELGGKLFYIVLDDVDVEEVVNVIMKKVVNNIG